MADEYGTTTPKSDPYTSFPVLTPVIITPTKDRIGQQDILPNALKTRLLGDIVQRTATATGNTGAGNFDNGEQIVFGITVSSTDNPMLMGAPEISLYVDSDGVGNNQLPGGTAIDETLYQWSWWLDWHKPNSAGNNSNNLYFSVYGLNIAGGAGRVLYIDTWCRLLSNKPGA
jgi:hypothetical protein